MCVAWQLKARGRCVTYVHVTAKLTRCLVLCRLGGTKAAKAMKTTRCCTICKNHGQRVSITSHVCPFTDCQCSLCQLTRLSRRVMCHQQRFWRHKKLDNKGSSTPDDPPEAAAHPSEAGQAEAATEVKATKQKRTKRDVVSYKSALPKVCRCGTHKGYHYKYSSNFSA